MPRETQQREDTHRAQTRAYPRLPVHSLAYIELSDENAGLILNISETGLSVQAVQTLNSNQFPRMRFRLPGTEISVEVAGRIVWQIKSKKEAGIEFVDAPSEVRAQIRRWIAQEPSRVAAAVARGQGETVRAPETTGPPGTIRPGLSASAKPASGHKTVPVSPSAAHASAQPSHVDDYTRPRDRAVVDTGDEQTTASPPNRKLIPPQGDRDWKSPSPDRDWRTPLGSPGPSIEFESDSTFPKTTLPERIPAMPHWNGYMAPGVGMEFKRPRKWWTYTAALGFIAALGIAGLMMFNPDPITRARIEALTHQVSTTENDAKPANPDNATNGNPAAPATRPDSVGSNAGVPSAPRPPLPSGQGSAPPPNPVLPNVTPDEHGRSEAQPNRSQGVQEKSSAPSGKGSPYNRSTATSSAARTANQYAYQPRAEAQSPPREPASPYTRYNQPTAPTNSPAANSTGGYARQPQASATNQYSSPTNRTGNPSAGNQNAVEAGRTQSVPSPQPPASNYPANSSSTSSNQRPVQQRDQDAYARPANTPPAPSNTTSRPISQPQVSGVEVPGYGSSPVPPSVPLAGVPSGSVGATSQFHAVRIPPELQYARSQLAGNLQVGQLVSSYSPAYPIGAAREGIEGTVRLEVLVARDGTVRNIQVLSGPPLLVSSATSAVRDWRYAETFLAGQPVETQQYVTIVFRLAK